MTTPTLRVARSRPGRRAGRDKAVVLDAACRVIADRGVDATRFTDVSAASGVPVSTLQYYFGSLEDLIIAVFRHNNERDMRRLREEAARSGDPWEQVLRLVGLAFGKGADENYDQSWLLWIEFWRTALRDEELAEECGYAETMWNEVFATTVRRGIDVGAFAPVMDAAEAVKLAMALIDGIGIRLTLNRPELAREHGMRIVVDALAAILRPDDAHSTPARSFSAE